MYQKILSAISILLISTLSFAQNTPSYNFTVDLTNVKNDKVTVELVTPKFTKNEVIYNIPKTVPGTYSNDDYGRYVSHFEAFDKKGKKLKVNKVNVNSYKVLKAKKLFRLKYMVDDSWDSPEISGTHIFEPTGSNIQKDTMFVINTHAFFGYFDNMKQANYNIKFKKPVGFYGATSMDASSSTATEDIFSMPNYHVLVDAPILYAKPDTTIINMGGTKILVALVSPNKMATSKEIAQNIQTLLEAQREYLGGKFPVSKYAFLIVLADVLPGSSYGALEHSYSSFYYLPEGSSDDLSQTIKDVASHEFFHIVTPLSIHAEQISEFDFNNPKMSKHLWMYEGLTEYAAGHMQIKHGLIDMPLYLSMLREKILVMKNQYKDDLPFTEMSENVLVKHKGEYQNVYNKGALIGLCLDIKLRQLSKGQYGTQNLMRDLAKTYGKDKAFKDDELFDKITELTYPEIRDFFKKYVEGPEPLPLTDILNSVGISYADEEKVKAINLGNVGLSYNPNSKRLVVASTSNINDFGKKVGYQTGDELVSINGENISIETYQKVIANFKDKAKEGDDFEVIVMRKNADGELAEIKLKTTLVGTEVSVKESLRINENANEDQMRLREFWLDPSKN